MNILKSAIVVVVMLMSAVAAAADDMEPLIGTWVSGDGLARQSYSREFDGSWISTRMWFKVGESWQLVATGSLFRHPGKEGWYGFSRTTSMEGIELFETRLEPVSGTEFVVSNVSYQADGSTLLSEETWSFDGSDRFSYTINTVEEGRKTPLYEGAWLRDSAYKVATVISAAELDAAQEAAPADSVSDQPVRHVESAEGRLGIGIVHRPVIKSGGPIRGIQHHKQSEVYRVMAGSGTLVTSPTMTEATTMDPDGFAVLNLTGPSDRGVIDRIENSQNIREGDVVIIPAGVAHGFSEITEPITYLVVRIDPERRVALK